MIDAIWVPPSVHFWAGMAVLVTTLGSIITTAILAWRNKALNRLAHAFLLLAQVSLIVQVLIGIKLLDQGLGPLQLYIHYLGGLGAFFFYLLFYWLPQSLKEQRWTALSLSTAAFLFAFMAFTIGSSYVAGSEG